MLILAVDYNTVAVPSSDAEWQQQRREDDEHERELSDEPRHNSDSQRLLHSSALPYGQRQRHRPQ